ncbi:MAG: response regulator [Lachnospiraceae bacterium]|nr:response regulator [Lachnospiraceae bacterium]
MKIKYNSKKWRIVRFFNIMEEMIEEAKTKEKVKVGRTVLVVDDDVMNLRMIEMTLKRKEYEVIKADSGQAALARLQEKAVDLILLDVEMPGMSGIETLDEIRSRQGLSQVPVLFLSASEDMEAAVENGEYAVQGFINKPILPQKLYERIEEFCN